MRPATLAVIGLFLTAGAVQAQSSDPRGTYVSENGETRLRIIRCGKAYCGTIVAAKGRARNIKNPNPGLRERGLVGIRMLSNFRPAGGMFTGRLYDYRDGKTYMGRMILKGTAMQLSGCIFDGLVCHSQSWTKVN